MTAASTESAARPLHEPSRIAPGALKKIRAFHTDAVAEVAKAVASEPVVVVGMAQNPHVKSVRKALEDANITFKYLEYGSYLSAWKERLAIKIWSGWPTFPQVFVQGTLLGGKDLTVAAIADGSLRKMLADKDTKSS